MSQPQIRLADALADRYRIDPEPSRVPHLDSVRAELGAVGDLE